MLKRTPGSLEGLDHFTGTPPAQTFAASHATEAPSTRHMFRVALDRFVRHCKEEKSARLDATRVRKDRWAFGCTALGVWFD